MVMKTLSVEEMKDILDNNLINECTKDEKEQVFAFAFGKKFMRSKNKGMKVQYK
jgi:hypothetical protein